MEVMKVKKMIKQIRTLIVVALAFVLFACGGGGGGGSAPNQPGGGGAGGGGTGGGAGGGGTGGGVGGVFVGGLLSGGLSLSIDVGSLNGVAVGVTEGGSGSPIIGFVQGFSSIVIDGRVINTDSAFIYVEGQLASQSDLRQGQSVAVLTDSSGSVANGVFYARLGQRLIHMLTTRTPSGLLYEADMRLRPNGNSGQLHGRRRYKKRR